jgi:hypothetical protein
MGLLMSEPRQEMINGHAENTKRGSKINQSPTARSSQGSELA